MQICFPGMKVLSISLSFRHIHDTNVEFFIAIRLLENAEFPIIYGKQSQRINKKCILCAYHVYMDSGIVCIEFWNNVIAQENYRCIFRPL